MAGHIQAPVNDRAEKRIDMGFDNVFRVVF
jgi:hypothetical protein